MIIGIHLAAEFVYTCFGISKRLKIGTGTISVQTWKPCHPDTLLYVWPYQTSNRVSPVQSRSRPTHEPSSQCETCPLYPLLLSAVQDARVPERFCISGRGLQDRV